MATSLTISGLPTNGETVHARLNSIVNGVLQHADYTYTASNPLPTVSALTCSSTSMIGAGTDSCTVTLNAAAPATGLSVNLSSSSTAVAVPATVTVPANATSAGFTATVTPVATSQAVTLKASAGSAAQTIALQLNASVPTLAVTTSNSSIAFGGAVTFTATISSGPSGSITFYDGATPIGAATINGTSAALTTASLIAGAHTITAYWPGNSNYAAVTSSAIAQAVNKATPTISWATPVAITYGTALSATQLDASSTVAGTFAYTPAATTVPKAGAQTLSATFTPTDTADYSSVTQTVTLTVNQAAPSITWATPSAITTGTALSATQLDASSTVAGTFVYTPAAGTVLKAGAQTLSVTFTPTDTTDYSSVTQIVTLTVGNAAPSVTWATPSAITYGTALSATQLNASSTVAGTFVYTPAAGTVLKAGVQTLSVTFTPTDTADYSSVTQTVTLTVNQAAPSITWPTPSAITTGTPLSAKQLDATSTVAGTFVYTPAAGTVPKAGAQTLSATFTPTDTTDYSSVTQTVTLTVAKARPSITWATPSAIAYGTALSATQLDASSTVAGTFVYTPEAGTVPKAGAQTLSVTFTPTDTTDYITSTATVLLTVGQATPTISWATPSAIAYGTALSATQLDASSTVAGTFVYTPAAGTVPNAGAQTLSVTFTPTDTTDYSSVTQTVTLTVGKATPVITWATPSAIISGTPLSATQLNASSTIPGTFVYSPAAGAILAVGSETLSVTFTPTDTADYTTVTQTVTLTVNAGTPTLSINAASVGFGNVAVNTSATQTVTLTSTGTASVTVSSASVTGTGFSLAGSTFSATLTPGQTANLGVQFDPSTTGAATGQLTIVSNSSTNSTALIPLTGTGTATAYAVDLSWNAPVTSSDPVVGYNVYRALSGSSTYQLLNSSVDTQTTYTDSTVQNGQAYDYIVESVDNNGMESVPTTPVAVTIP
jgi:hypothetical protein